MSTALAERKETANTLKALLDRQRPELQRALSTGLSVERFMATVLTAVKMNPGLLECSPLSIIACAQQAANYNLEMGSVLGQAYMVPYWNKHTRSKEAQFQVGYRGLVTLAFRSGLVSTFSSHVVRAKDDFHHELGSSPFIRHLPSLDPEPGDVVAVYAVLRLRDGQSDFEVMSKAAIEAHRQRYSKGQGGGPWDSAWEEMAKKTVVRRLAKRAPVSIEMQEAALKDEYGEAGVNQELPEVANSEAATRAKLHGLKQRIGLLPAERPAPAGPPKASTPTQLETLLDLFRRLRWTDEQVGYFLEAWQVPAAVDLTAEQADEAIAQCKTQLKEMEAIGARSPGEEADTN